MKNILTENKLVKNLRAYPVLHKRWCDYIKGVRELPEGFTAEQLFHDYLKVRRSNPEKRVSMSEYMIFGFYGLDYKNIEPIFLPYGETADQFKDRQVDGFVFTIGTPNPAIQDITTAQEVVFVPLAGQKVDEIVKKFPYLVKDSIPAGTYLGQKDAVPTLSVQCILVANKNMPDDVAYTLTKTLYDNLPDVAKAHNKGAEISLEHAADGVTIPFHPGAIKYFKEKGLDIK